MRKNLKIFILIPVVMFFVSINDVFASVYLGGTKLTSQNYKVVNQGNVNIAFGNDQVYSSLATFPSYYRITFCSDVSAVNSWYSTNNGNSIPYLIDVDFYVTNYSCKFPNSTYTGGHVVYVYGTSNPATACSTSGTNCYQSATTTRLVFYNPAGSSWAILNEAYSQEPYEMDYASQTIITSNDALVDSQDYANGLLDRITQQNINTYNMEQNEFNQTQQKIDDIQNADYNGSTEQPDTNDYDDYIDKEDDILDAVQSADLDNVDIAIDDDSSSFVWDTMTSLLQSNSYVFGLMISILSIGILKLVLGR